MKHQFDGTRETESAPRHFNGKNVYSHVKDLDDAQGKKSTTLGKRKRNTKGSKKIRWKKRSILWELPYWIDLAVCHSINVPWSGVPTSHHYMKTSNR